MIGPKSTNPLAVIGRLSPCTGVGELPPWPDCGDDPIWAAAKTEDTAANTAINALARMSRLAGNSAPPPLSLTQSLVRWQIEARCPQRDLQGFPEHSAPVMPLVSRMV